MKDSKLRQTFSLSASDEPDRSRSIVLTPIEIAGGKPVITDLTLSDTVNGLLYHLKVGMKSA
jgi:uncharacterized protein (DUF433 family)